MKYQPIVTLRQEQLAWTYEQSNWNPDESYSVLDIQIDVSWRNLTTAIGANITGTVPATYKDDYAPEGYEIWISSDGKGLRALLYYSNTKPTAGDLTSELTVEIVTPDEYENINFKIVVTGVGELETINETITRTRSGLLGNDKYSDVNTGIRRRVNKKHHV